MEFEIPREVFNFSDDIVPLFHAPAVKPSYFLAGEKKHKKNYELFRKF